MAVPANTITIRDIFNEINGTSHGANAQIGSGVTMSSLNAASNAYTSGTANHTGVNTTNNVLVAPDTMAEWANYTHAETFTGSNAPSYLLRTGTTTSSYGMRELTDAIDPPPTECDAEGGMFLTRYSPSGGGYTKIFVDVMKESDLNQLNEAEGTNNRR